MPDDATRSTDAIREHVANTLKHFTVQRSSITDQTELYYDLGLTGIDLGEAIEAVRERFGTDFSAMDLRRYAPNEVGHNFGLNLVREFREWRGERTYRSLTVASIIAAVQAGFWSDR